MRKILLPILCLFYYMVNGQQNVDQIIYIEGSSYLKEYPFKTNTMDVDYKVSVDTCPILNYFCKNKKLFIGGTLQNGITKRTTKIMDIKLISHNDFYEFVVIGENFSSRIFSNRGELLSIDKNRAVFYDVGNYIWEICSKI